MRFLLNYVRGFWSLYTAKDFPYWKPRYHPSAIYWCHLWALRGAYEATP